MNKERQQFVIFYGETVLMDIKYDIYLLHRHMDLVREQLKSEWEKFEKNKSIDVSEIEEGIFNEHLIEYEKQRIKNFEKSLRANLPQIIINPFIVSLWSLYETVIKDFAEILREEKKITKKLHQADGKYFIAKAINYFKKDLERDLFLSNKHSKDFRFLGNVRNSIAHHYAKFSSLSGEVQNKLKNKEYLGIQVHPEKDKIILSLEFAEHMFESVRDHLLTLLNKYQNVS
ncbi:hypothetical protein [Gracilimonas sediminicola]|uniref:hypothetical protein n=1 Tax=Gracilimonas sediminicola TaxID=2952158 RepID=UPI0038D38FC6